MFNDCLDNTLPPWELEGLRSLDFWEFIDYLCYRYLAMSCRPKSIAVPPEMPDPAPVDNEPSLPLSRKRRLRRRRAAKFSEVTTESPNLLLPWSGGPSLPLASGLFCMSGNPQSPLMSLLQSKRPQSPLQSPLLSESPQSLLMNPLQSRSP